MVVREKELTDTRFRTIVRDKIVLCVDDDAETLNALRRLLRDEPYRVMTTDRPYQALSWFDANRISLVITDYRMPEMPGTQLLQEIARKSAATARFLLTAYTGSQEIIDALGHAVQGVISKPWDGQALKRTIRAILQWQDERERSAVEG